MGQGESSNAGCNMTVYDTPSGNAPPSGGISWNNVIIGTSTPDPCSSDVFITHQQQSDQLPENDGTEETVQQHRVQNPNFDENLLVLCGGSTTNTQDSKKFRTPACKDPSKWLGQKSDNKKIVCDSAGENYRECVSLVKQATGEHGGTDSWIKGPKVSKETRPGTAIATFNKNGGENYDGKSKTPGKGHAAIFLGYNPEGNIRVMDIWKDHPKEHIVERALRFKGGKPNTDGNSNDADQFHEIRIQNEEKKEEKKKGTEV